MKARLLTYADFQPGAALGEHVEPYTPELAAAWRSIFGDAAGEGASGPAEAASVAVVLAMRAYLAVVSPRPPGNVQARQRFTLHRLPRPGERVRSVLHCVDKQIKRERRCVDLQVQGLADGGEPLYTGHMSLIWAA